VTVLVVAALPEEIVPIRTRLRGVDSVVVAMTGAGRRRAETDMRALLASHRPDAWIGAGLAGAATPGIPVGTILVARNVGDPHWSARALARGGALPATVVTVDRIAATGREKADFAARGASGDVVALDMETAGWIAAAALASPAAPGSSGSPPGLVIRVVSDEADEEIPDFVAAASSADGLDRRRIALHALAHPSAVGKLLAMRRRARFCAERLAGFLEVLARRGFDLS